jgi:hypothetical protein
MQQEAPRRAGQSQPCRAPPDRGTRRSRTRQLLKVAASLSFVSPSLDLLVAHATSVEKMLTHANIVYETRSQSLPVYHNTQQPDTTTEPDNDPAPDSPRMLLDCSQQPTFVDPQAAICWSANLQPQIKSSFKMGSLIGRGSGESFQLAFHGPGFVVVQPSEGQPVVASS